MFGQSNRSPKEQSHAWTIAALPPHFHGGVSRRGPTTRTSTYGGLAPATASAFGLAPVRAARAFQCRSRRSARPSPQLHPPLAATLGQRPVYLRGRSRTWPQAGLFPPWTGPLSCPLPAMWSPELETP